MALVTISHGMSMGSSAVETLSAVSDLHIQQGSVLQGSLYRGPRYVQQGTHYRGRSNKQQAPPDHMGNFICATEYYHQGPTRTLCCTEGNSICIAPDPVHGMVFVCKSGETQYKGPLQYQPFIISTRKARQCRLRCNLLSALVSSLPL